MKFGNIRRAWYPLTFGASMGLALVAASLRGSRLAAEQPPVQLELSDDPNPAPFFAEPTPAEMSPAETNAAETSPAPLLEQLPGPSPSATSREPVVDPQAWQLLHRDFSDAESKSAQEFNRVSEGISRLQSSLQQQVSLQQRLVEAMIQSQREAEQAKQRAELERQRMQSLLAEPPWAKEPSHRTTPPSTAPVGSHDSHVEESVPPAHPGAGGDAPTSEPHAADAGPPELLPTPTIPVGSREPAAGSSHATHEGPRKPPKSESPTAVTDSALDRPRLADSLYGAGRYDLALRLYDAVSREPEFATDQTWFYYQIAGCFRHLGDSQQAARYYRMVAAAKDSAGLSDHAKWWLANLQEHQQLAQGLASLQEMLQKTDHATLQGTNE